MSATAQSALRKWNSDDLGPRQTQEFKKAISSFEYEAQVHTEINDHGQSTCFMLFDPWQPGAAETLQAIQDKYAATVTGENHRAIIALIDAATAKLKQTRPVIDKRTTPEQRAESKRLYEEREREQAQRDQKYRAVWEQILAKRPPRAEAVIVAQLEKDESEPWGDYSASKTVRRVAIGWRTGKREDFRQLRRAAAQFPETRHLGPDSPVSPRGRELERTRAEEVEHRDTYSNGNGNWVGEDRYSGWQVQSIDLNSKLFSLEHPDMIEDLLPAQTVAAQKMTSPVMPMSTTIVSPSVCDPQSDASLDTLIDLASKSCGWVERNARYLVDKVERLEAAGTWPKKLQGEPKTWARFCTEVLGYPAYYIEYIREAVNVLDSQAADQGDGR